MSDIRKLIFTPAELSSQYIRRAKKIQSDPGVTWGIPSVDRHVLPARGGDVTLIVGRPGDGKTTVLCYLANTEARRIMERGAEEREVVVYVTWEGAVDDIYASMISARAGYSNSDYYWGNIPIEDASRAASQHGTFPILFIGFSTMREAGRVSLTLDKLWDAIAEIEDGKLLGRKYKIKALFGDYLQLIPVSGADTKVDRVSEAIVGAKNLGIEYDFASFYGAQAGRQVDNYQWKLATESDVQWSSQGEQHTDKLFSIWRAARTETINPNAEQRQILRVYNTYPFPLTNNLFVMEMRKQRGEFGRHLWGLYMAPQFLNLAEMERDLEEI